MNLQITFGVIFVLFTAAIILYLVNDWFIPQDNFYEKIGNVINHDKHTAFIIGSSHVNVLNFTYLNEYIIDHGQNYQIINLGRGADRFVDRVNDIDKIIALKPSIVYYGIDYFDFNDKNRNTKQVVNSQQLKSNEKLLPDPIVIFSKFLQLNNIPWINIQNFKNPKLTTLTLFEKDILIPMQNVFTKSKGEIENETIIKMQKEEQDRLKQIEHLRSIASLEAIAADAKRWGAYTPHYIEEDNARALAFKKMMKKFNESGIKVVIFTTPRHQLWWDALNDDDKDGYFKIMDSLSNDYRIEIYYLHNKYSDLDIWTDSHHITTSPPGMIYTKDVAEIILKTLEE